MKVLGATGVVALWVICIGVLAPGCKGKDDGATNKPSVEEPAAVATGAPTSPCSDKDADACRAALEAATKSENDAEVFRLAQEGCENGIGIACWELAVAQKNGAGTAKDFVAAMGSFQTACDLGHLDSCVQAALVLQKSPEPEALKAAMEMLTMACKGENGVACELAAGNFLTVESPEAQRLGLQLMRRACELGQKTACSRAEQEAKWAADDDDIAARTAEMAAPAAPSQPNVEWVVAPAIAHLVSFSKVKGCAGSPRFWRCSVVMQVKGKLQRNVRSSVLDADGVRLDYGIALSPRYTTPGVAEAVDINLQGGAVKVVFDY